MIVMPLRQTRCSHLWVLDTNITSPELSVATQVMFLRSEVAKGAASRLLMQAQLDSGACRTAPIGHDPQRHAGLGSSQREGPFMGACERSLLSGRLTTLHRDSTELRLMAAQYRLTSTGAAGAAISRSSDHMRQFGSKITTSRLTALEPLRATCMQELLDSKWV